MHEELINFLNKIGCVGPKEDYNGNISILDVKESDFEKVEQYCEENGYSFCMSQENPFWQDPNGDWHPNGSAQIRYWIEPR